MTMRRRSEGERATVAVEHDAVPEAVRVVVNELALKLLTTEPHARRTCVVEELPNVGCRKRIPGPFATVSAVLGWCD